MPVIADSLSNSLDTRDGHERSALAERCVVNRPSLSEREKRLLRDLAALGAERAEAETAAQRALRCGQQAARGEHEQAIVGLEERLQAETARRSHDRLAAEALLATRMKAEHAAIEREYHEGMERASREIEAAESEVQQVYKEARWLARTVFEAGRKRIHQAAAEVQKELRGHLQQARLIEQQAIGCLAYFGQKKTAVPPFIDPSEDEDEYPIERLVRAIEAAENHLRRLEALRLPRFVVSGDFLMIFVALAAVIGPITGWLADWQPSYWLPPALGATLGAGVPISLWLRALARRQVAEQYVPLIERVHEAEAHCGRCLTFSLARVKAQCAEIRARREEEVRTATEVYRPRMADCRLRRELEIPQLTAIVEGRLADLKRQFDDQQQQLQQGFARDEANARTEHERALDDAQRALDDALAAIQGRFDRARSEYLDGWRRGIAAARAEVNAICAELDGFCPAWAAVLSDGWKPLQTAAEAIRFGTLSIDLKKLLGNKVSEQIAADAGSVNFSLPALLSFPDDVSLLIRCQDAGRRAAVELLQVAMLRLLLTVPPGKARFTIVDPVGLGQNFAAFMHLADYDEALVGHRIWTEPTQIEQRLADLTEHMETVIQKYLRDEYPTIGAYNAEAGEIAEPYRALVIANFPAGFSEAAVRRLLSIAANGRRCGVHVLMSVDTKLSPIPDFPLADLAQHATLFSMNGTQVVWQDRELKGLPLALDAPPASEQCKAILQRVGQAAVSAKRVEVPFEAIAPAAELHWTADSRHGIDVPLGRVGATRLQHLRLGHGTSQHVLIAGKTGSGKSTLLHALITNAALRYSPDEVELYLIDFKKGVEFKTYVTHELPHARVVAIESEREFGLSVMHRLDAELRARGERFRQAGVQDIAGYRNLNHSLPRILFVVDEFQEFFVEEDKLAQEAALLLDRLIRQGRAFGIHVHLGSQTLAGAYTLARSTLGQVGVRIALQCSEADAHLILSEDNQAARLLSRPGEAIYNDANGLVEGNHPFQVVWLPDDRREVYLERVQQLAAQQPARQPLPQIVFEGTQPADIEKNGTLGELLGSGTWSTQPGEPRVWIGEPLAIQATTSVTFARRGASNLLWLGQNDEAVAGMICAAILSLAAQLPPGPPEAQGNPAQFIILTGTTGGSFAALQQLASAVPNRLQLVGARFAIFARVARRRASAAEPNGREQSTAALSVRVRSCPASRATAARGQFQLLPLRRGAAGSARSAIRRDSARGTCLWDSQPRVVRHADELQSRAGTAIAQGIRHPRPVADERGRLEPAGRCPRGGPAWPPPGIALSRR